MDRRFARLLALSVGVSLLIAGAALFIILFLRTGAPAGAEPGRRAGVQTILVGGTDSDGTRTDTILVCAVDTKNDTAAVMSIPRDTRAFMENGKVHKINAAHNKGMARMLTEVKNTVGFAPDRYCIVDYAAFAAVIDALGGVTVDVAMDMDYSDPAQDLEIHLKAGEQVLNGEKALQYMRFRSGYRDADLGRIRAQQKLLAAAAKKLTSPRALLLLPKLPGILRDTETDLSFGEAVRLGLALLRAYKAGNLEICTLPGKAVGADFAADEEKTLALVNERLNPYTEPIRALNLP